MTNSTDSCIDPTAISDDEVVAYALDEAIGHTIDHVERCSFCQAKAGMLRQTALFLQRDVCPPTIKIGELVHGLLTAQEELVLSAHIRSCASCTDERARFGEFMASSDAQTGIAGAITSLKRILAQPMQRSATEVSGLRGNAGNDSRAYTAENAAVVYLDIDRETLATQSKMITGRVEQLSGDPTEGMATLLIEQRIVASESLDDGYFYFSGVRAGTYRIELSTQDLQIVIEPLEII